MATIGRVRVNTTKRLKATNTAVRKAHKHDVAMYKQYKRVMADAYSSPEAKRGAEAARKLASKQFKDTVKRAVKGELGEVLDAAQDEGPHVYTKKLYGLYKKLTGTATSGRSVGGDKATMHYEGVDMAATSVPEVAAVISKYTHMVSADTRGSFL